MMDLKKVAFGSLVVASLFFAGGELAQAETQTGTQQVLVSEQEKALAAGYTTEQFQAIMNQPTLVSEEAAPASMAQERIRPRSSSADDKRNAVVAEALKQKGIPFAWGGNTPATGFDSSGLIQYVYKTAVQINLPRSTVLQEKEGEEVSLSALKPGDLLFYGNRGQTYSVTIYIGNGQMVYSPEPGDVVKVTGMQYWKPSFARRMIKDTADPGTTPGEEEPEVSNAVYRIYNPNGGNHHFTLSKAEADNLIRLGWRNEGIGWITPTSGDSVYRVYNPNNGRHHYTVSAGEKDSLVKVGWEFEGIGWLSGGTVPVYRVYNPYAPATEDSHHYTTSKGERDSLVKVGWRNEGIGWYAEKAN